MARLCAIHWTYMFLRLCISDSTMSESLITDIFSCPLLRPPFTRLAGLFPTLSNHACNCSVVRGFKLAICWLVSFFITVSRFDGIIFSTPKQPVKINLA